jgi:hypothetical protein
MPDPATGSASTTNSTMELRPGTIQAAQSAFEKMLSRSAETSDSGKQPSKKAPHQTSEATGDAGAEEESHEPTAEELAAAESAEETAEDSEEPESEETDEQPSEQLYTVTIDGKEEHVKASELIAGYQRNQSYTRKSMALAEARKSFEATQTSVTAERAEYANLLPQLRKALTVAEPDWAKIKAEQPADYPVMWADWQQHQAKLAAVTAEERRVNAVAQADFDRKREELITNERNLFLKAEPSWQDPKVAVKDAKEVQALLESLGYSGDDLNIYDHRALRLALMAAKYKRGLSAKANLIKQRANGAPVITSGSGPAVKVAKGKAEKARFMKTGSLQDAARMFETSGILD